MAGKPPADLPRVVNYGSVDCDVENQQKRRSTISTLRQSIATITANTAEKLHSHTMSTLALCSSVLCMMYLLMSAFPYSGFMAMQLVPGLTYQNAGGYAGILSGSFMIGRLFSAYPWGIVSDTYGRKFVLLFSTGSSAVLMLAFGFSFDFYWAIFIRFLTGLLNGTMIAARVSVTELAKGNHDLEAKGMGLVMSMVGFGMLLGPALGGVLSEPITQYPNVDFGSFESLLLDFPFLLPNLVGAILCAISTIQIALSVEETLPLDKLRSPKYIIPDALSYMTKLFADFCKGTRRPGGSDSEYESIVNSDDTSIDDSEADSIAEDLKLIGTHFGECGDAVAMATRDSRASFSAALHRPSTATVVRPSVVSTLGGVEEGHPTEKESTLSHQSANISSLMSDRRVRECLDCYWVTTFASTSAGECFPLFAMAKIGGLGIEETAIGVIGAGSGLLFVVSQYFIFSASMKRFGLHKTMVSSALFAVPPIILIPISLLLKSKTAEIIYLSVLNGIMLIAFSNWNAALTITQNRRVHPSDRAKLNGLAAVGASVGRGGGPIFAGALVTLSYTSGVVPTAFGSLIVYFVIAALGIYAYILNTKIENDIDDEVK